MSEKISLDSSDFLKENSADAINGSIQKIIRLINAIIAFFILYTHVDSASQI